MLYESEHAGFGRLMRLVDQEQAGELAYGEFAERFLPLWGAHGAGYWRKGLTDDTIVSLLRRDEPLLVTVDEEIERLDLPDTPIEVYRGASVSYPLGISWSTNFDVACSFALRQRESGAVAIATVTADAVLGGIELQQAQEPPYYEYLIDTSRIDPPRLVPYNDRQVIEGAIRDMDRRLKDNRFEAFRYAILKWRHYAVDLGRARGLAVR